MVNQFYLSLQGYHTDSAIPDFFGGANCRPTNLHVPEKWKALLATLVQLRVVQGAIIY